MKTIIYFLSVFVLQLCTSPVLLSQDREIGVIGGDQPILTNNDNAVAYFKAVYGSSISVSGLNIQWSKEYNSFFLIGTTNARGVAGLQLTPLGTTLKATAGPGIEITCAPSGDCTTCNLSDAVCQCTYPPDATGLCKMVAKRIITVW